MAREASITQEQVNAAAERLRAAGSKPTARGVREALGGGSMATVLKLLQAWQGAQVRAAEAPLVLPPGLQRALVDFMAQEVNDAKVELQADLSTAQQANSDLITENERQEATIDALAAAIDALQAEKAGLAGRLAQVESDLARSEDESVSERQAAEQARTELAKALLRLEAVPRIEADVERLRGELDRERTAKVAAEQMAAVALAKLDAMTERATKAEVLAEKIEKQAQQAAQDAISARAQLQAQRAALDAAARDLEGARALVKDVRAEAKKSSEEAAELRGQLAAAKDRAGH